VLRHPIVTSRRTFLAGALGASAALALDPRAVFAGTNTTVPTVARSPRPYYGDADIRHTAWVWQFRYDGQREAIRDTLAEHGLGIVMKTHDGDDWMSRYDQTPYAISGPRKVEELASFFENGGVPFHAWAVLHGNAPETEARMAADVLSAGARSMSLDLEPHQGFWRGTPQTAVEYGDTLRALQPNATIVTSVDPRPWEIGRIPLREFSAFSDALAPQVYWKVFSSSGNVRRYTSLGEDPGPDGVTPRFALNSALNALAPFGLPIVPVGDGTDENAGQWRDFIDESYARESDAVSVWRFGVATPELWRLLLETPPRQGLYYVQPGDTLGTIAQRTGTDIGSLIAANGIENPNYLYVGQQLRLPRGTRGIQTISTAVSAPAVPTTYTVEAGDSLWRLATRWRTTPEAIASANGLGTSSLIRIGQVLTIP
jgi:LysM repeat protein